MTEKSAEPHGLIRGVTLSSATTLNVIDMVGVGPFITIPLIIVAMGGPQAMIGWIIGAGIAMCDGLVWAELGAAFPGSGGSYRYLSEAYGKKKLGRLMSFLFIWQLTFSAPLSIASGCIGLSLYATYVWPSLGTQIGTKGAHLSLPWLGSLDASFVVTASTFLAIGVCVLAVFLLYRRITIIGRLSKVLGVGVLLTVLWVIVSGVTHFNPGLAFDFPPDAFTLSPKFFTGLGAALLVSLYDYWGYYNVCFFGEEVKDPGRNIPRAIIYSILLVAVLYVIMNISILGVVPWRDLGETAASDARRYVVADFMERIYGKGCWEAVLVSLLIMWTAFASVFSLILGYSRVPYAASLDGNYFKIFSRVHPKHRFPYVSLLVMGTVAALFCFLKLEDVIKALVVIRLLIQFLSQTVGLIVLRNKQPDLPRPFRMWLYPLPAILALIGFIYVLLMRDGFQKQLKYALVLIVLGLGIYFWRSWKRGKWPFESELSAANN